MSEKVINWFETNTNLIGNELVRERELLLDMPPEDRALINPSRRSLSEMGLCGAALRIPPPPGYSVRGWSRKIEVPYGSETITSESIHDYFGREDEIVDVVPGQFVLDFNVNTRPGDRIARLREMAPDNVHAVDTEGFGQLAILYGQIDLLLKLTGIRYE